MRRSKPFVAVLLLLFTCVAASAFAADPPWVIKSADGKSSLAFGFLVQPQSEWLTTPDGQDTSRNLFVRRLRLIFGGKATDWLSFFIDTDNPNLGKGNLDGTKTSDSMFIQDAIFTVTARPEFQLDAGMLLVPLSHNGGQSAGTLLAPDYGAYSFLASDPMMLRMGRDFGAQARGYVANHLEYRAGVFQGKRGVNADAPFRYFARAVWYPFDAETGFFYSGTTLGAKRIVAVGASVDHQASYHTYGTDVYLDQPTRGGDALTLQVNYNRFNGGVMLPALPPRDAWLIEGGYFLHGSRLEPFVQVAFDEPTGHAPPQQRKYQGGVAFWVDGHRCNMKLGIARVTRSAAPDRTQVVVQGQIFMW